MAEKMKKTGKTRHRQLSAETSRILSHICHGFVDLAKYLLNAGNDYVIFGWFTTDPLEKYFSKLRQGSGGTYFISAQSVIEKVRIHRAKLSTALNLDFDADVDSTHQCDTCHRPLTQEECEILDNMEELEKNIQTDVVIGIVYIAGYVARKFQEVDSDDTIEYYKKYGTYLDKLNKGGLCIPRDGIVQWSLFCFISFSTFSQPICRNFVVTTFLRIAEKYYFYIDEKQCRILCNIFMKNMSVINTPGSSKETQLKVLKLS